MNFGILGSDLYVAPIPPDPGFGDTYWEPFTGDTVWDGTRWINTTASSGVQLVPITTGPNVGWQNGFNPDSCEVVVRNIAPSGTITPDFRVRRTDNGTAFFRSGGSIGVNESAQLFDFTSSWGGLDAGKLESTITENNIAVEMIRFLNRYEYSDNTYWEPGAGLVQFNWNPSFNYWAPDTFNSGPAIMRTINSGGNFNWQQGFRPRYISFVLGGEQVDPNYGVFTATVRDNNNRVIGTASIDTSQPPLFANYSFFMELNYFDSGTGGDIETIEAGFPPGTGDDNWNVARNLLYPTRFYEDAL